MVYATCVGLLLTLAATLFERPLRNRARATRAVWLGILVGALVWPVTVAMLGRAATPEVARSNAGALASPRFDAAPVPAVAAPILSPVLRLPAIVSPSATFDLAARRVAIVSPLVLLALFLIDLARIGRARRRWQPDVIDGVPVLLSVDFGPAIVGVVNPRIVVPAWTRALPPEQRALLLAHESEHLASHDSRWLGVAFLAVVIAPWNIGFWWLLRRFRLAIEVDCDRRVLLRGHDLEEYGNLLIEIGRHRAGHTVFAAGFAERRSMLRTRIDRMTAAAGVTRAGRAWRIAAGMALVLAACSIGPARADRERTPPAFALMPGVADSMVEAKGSLRGDRAAQALPAAFHVATTSRSPLNKASRCPVALADDRDGTALALEAEQQHLSPPSSDIGVSRRVVDGVVGYYSVRPGGRYGVDSLHWLRVGCVTAGTPRLRSSDSIASAGASPAVDRSEGTVPPSVQSVLGRFPPPANGLPSIATRFSDDTVRVGEQLDLITVTWVPQTLLGHVRHAIRMTLPSLTGVSATVVSTPFGFARQGPIAFGTRYVGEQAYDWYVSWQTIEALGVGQVAVSPSQLIYTVPASANFAPEEQRTVEALSTVLVVRPQN